MSTIGDRGYSVSGIGKDGDIGIHGDGTKTNEMNLICDKCKSNSFWLPKKSTTWRCLKCKPPSTQAIVDRTNLPQSPVEPDAQPLTTWGPWLIAYGRPACLHCHGAWIHESQGVNGQIELKCWSCKRTIDALLKDDRISSKSLKGIHSKGNSNV